MPRNSQIRAQKWDVPWWWLLWPCLPIGVALWSAYTAYEACSSLKRRAKSALWEARQRRRAATQQMPKSTPLIERSDDDGDGPSATSEQRGRLRGWQQRRRGRGRRPPPAQATRSRSGPCFLDLPAEIRHKIYVLAVHQHRFAQPSMSYRNRVFKTHWGVGMYWLARRRICSDDDPPSRALQIIVGIGGSALRQAIAPRKQGCLRYSAPCMLFPSHSLRMTDCFSNVPESPVHHHELMRACREVYADVLPLLYGEVTVCLFGTEMVGYFLRNVSPEGLRLVRYVHLALLVPAGAWDSPSSREAVGGALRDMAGKMPGLEQLHVEVVLLFGQPADTRDGAGDGDGDGGPSEFWRWLRKSLETAGLSWTRLHNFVLKVTVYTPNRGVGPSIPGVNEDEEAPDPRGYFGRFMHRTEPFAAWDEDEYSSLKAAMTAGAGKDDCQA